MHRHAWAALLLCLFYMCSVTAAASLSPSPSLSLGRSPGGRLLLLLLNPSEETPVSLSEEWVLRAPSVDSALLPLRDAVVPPRARVRLTDDALPRCVAPSSVHEDCPPSEPLLEVPGVDALLAKMAASSAAIQHLELVWRGAVVSSLELTLKDPKPSSVHFHTLSSDPSSVTLTGGVFPSTLSPSSKVGTLGTVDADAGDTHTYALVSGSGDTDNGKFSIANVNEVLTAQSFSGLVGAKSIRVRSTDSDGGFVEEALALTVESNVGPSGVTLSSTLFNEHLPVGTVVATILVTDANQGDQHTCALISGFGSSGNVHFSIEGLQLKMATSTLSGPASLQIRMRCTDAGGLFRDLATGMTVSSVNDNPTDIALSASSFTEKSAVGTTVGTFSTSDLDSGDSFTYTLVSGSGSANNGLFTVVGSQLRVGTAGIMAGAYSIRVRSTDSGGLWFEKAFSLNATNVPDAPSDLTLSQNTFPERSAVGTVVGTLSSTDDDAGETFTYSLAVGTGDTDNSKFSVSGNELRVLVANLPQGSYSVRIRTTDSTSLTFEKAFTLVASNAPFAPSSVSLSSNTFPEHSAAGTVVGRFMVADVDAEDTHTISLVSGSGSTDNALFVVQPDSSGNSAPAELALASGSIEEGSYSIRVRVLDSGGLFLDQQLTITATHVNQAPTSISLSSLEFENVDPAGTVVGILSAVDPDGTTTFSFSLVSGTGSTDNGKFAIQGAQLRLAQSELATGTYHIRVQVTDPAGGFFTKSLTLTSVLSLPSAPGTPQLVAGSLSKQGFTVNFSPATTKSAAFPVTGHVLHFHFDSSFPQTGLGVVSSSSSLTQMSVSSAYAFVSYFVRVAATNSFSQGPWSPVAGPFQTLAGEPPPPSSPPTVSSSLTNPQDPSQQVDVVPVTIPSLISTGGYPVLSYRVQFLFANTSVAPVLLESNNILEVSGLQTNFNFSVSRELAIRAREVFPTLGSTTTSSSTAAATTTTSSTASASTSSSATTSSTLVFYSMRVAAVSPAGVGSYSGTSTLARAFIPSPSSPDSSTTTTTTTTTTTETINIGLMIGVAVGAAVVGGVIVTIVLCFVMRRRALERKASTARIVERYRQKKKERQQKQEERVEGEEQRRNTSLTSWTLDDYNYPGGYALPRQEEREFVRHQAAADPLMPWSRGPVPAWVEEAAAGGFLQPAEGDADSDSVYSFAGSGPPSSRYHPGGRSFDMVDPSFVSQGEVMVVSGRDRGQELPFVDGVDDSQRVSSPLSSREDSKFFDKSTEVLQAEYGTGDSYTGPGVGPSGGHSRGGVGDSDEDDDDGASEEYMLPRMSSAPVMQFGWAASETSGATGRQAGREVDRSQGATGSGCSPQPPQHHQRNHTMDIGDHLLGSSRLVDRPPTHQLRYDDGTATDYSARTSSLAARTLSWVPSPRHSSLPSLTPNPSELFEVEHYSDLGIPPDELAAELERIKEELRQELATGAQESEHWARGSTMSDGECDGKRMRAGGSSSHLRRRSRKVQQHRRRLSENPVSSSGGAAGTSTRLSSSRSRAARSRENQLPALPRGGGVGEEEDESSNPSRSSLLMDPDELAQADEEVRSWGSLSGTFPGRDVEVMLRQRQRQRQLDPCAVLEPGEEEEEEEGLD